MSISFYVEFIHIHAVLHDRIGRDNGGGAEVMIPCLVDSTILPDFTYKFNLFEVWLTTSSPGRDGDLSARLLTQVAKQSVGQVFIIDIYQK